MTDLSDWLRMASDQCPLLITDAEWADPVLSLRGVGWSIAATSAWRIVAAQTFVIGVYDEDPAGHVAGLRGKSVTKFSVLDPAVPIDVAVELSDGKCLQILCVTGHENWVLHLEGEATMAFVPD